MYRFKHNLFLIASGALLLGISMLCCCSSLSSNNTDYTHNPKIVSLINNKQSMTTWLRRLNYQFSVEQLYSGIESSEYRRFAALKLDNTPTIVAISATTKDNPTFYNILSTTQNTSIGLKLFAKNSGIVRESQIEITTMKLSEVNSKVLYNYLVNLGYKPNDKIIARHSIFKTKDGNQRMYLTEFVLPAILAFL